MKSLLLFCLSIMALSVQAQDYKPFKITLSAGYAQPVGPGSSGGFLLSVEPKYGFSDHVDLGLRLETGLMARSVSYNGIDGDADLKGLGSALVTANYYLSTASVRPYMGVGGGIFSLAGTTVKINNGQTTDSQSLVADTSFGLMGRVGVKAGHFNVAAEYNFIPNTSIQLQTATLTSKNAYLGFKLGVDLGGGRR